MLPSSFRGEGVDDARTSAQNTDNATENTTTSQRPRTITMRNPFDVPIMRDMIGSQDSYDDALLPSTSSDPHHLIGFQTDPELQEQQKEQEKAERQIAKAPNDLRDVLNKKEQNKIEQLAKKREPEIWPMQMQQTQARTPPPYNSRRLDEHGFLTNSCRRRRHGDAAVRYCYQRRGASAERSQVRKSRLRFGRAKF